MFSGTSKTVRSLYLAAFGCGFVGAILSCGRDETTVPELATLKEWKSDELNVRFTEIEKTNTYSLETEVIDGKKFPKSNPAIKYTYDIKTAPEKFKTEYGDFTAGAELKGYLNMGFSLFPVIQGRLISNFEKISTWKTITDKDGKPIFANSSSTDIDGQKIPDVSDGVASSLGETLYGTLGLQTNTPIGDIAVPVTVTIYNKDGLIQTDVLNRYDVKAPFVGTIIKAGNLKIYLKSFPFKKGWFVYGSSVVKLEKLENTIKPEVMANYIDGFFGWLKTNSRLEL